MVPGLELFTQFESKDKLPIAGPAMYVSYVAQAGAQTQNKQDSDTVFKGIRSTV